MTSEDDPKLTTWIAEHLQVAPVVVDDPDTLDPPQRRRQRWLDGQHAVGDEAPWAVAHNDLVDPLVNRQRCAVRSCRRGGILTRSTSPRIRHRQS
jgi:hypothetical protein